MPDIGGGSIKRLTFVRGWGVNPSAASGEVILSPAAGGVFGLAVGSHVAYSFGSLSAFTGIVSEVGQVKSFAQGAEQSFQVVDNRVRLAWQTVFGAWNIEDDLGGAHLGRPASPSSGGDSSSHGTEGASFLGLSDPPEPVGAGEASAPPTPWQTRRRYRHLLPQHWQSGIWTWTSAPMTAREILNSAFNHAWGDFGFSRSYHSALSSAIITGLDYSTGVKLSNLVAEINSRTGLDVTISGSRTLIWGRKGDGLPPLPDATCTPISSGVALTSADTGVRVVGDRVRMQRLNIALEPDWKSGWQAWIDEVSWRREVAQVFSLPTATKSDQLELSAFAKKVTVYQFAKRKSDDSLLDTRRFGAVSRVQLPAWVYIQELVYRSYRIPPGFSLHGVPLSSLELADSLLCNTDISGEGASAKQCYADSPIQFYPSVQATAIVRGQPLDLINARDIRLFYRNSTRDLRNEWTAAGDFEVDPVGKSIRFGVPTFIDGDPAAGKSIYLRKNRGEGGGVDLSSKVGADSDYLDIVVPNPDFEITPAEVKASFCFLLGHYFRDYGQGPRRGAMSARGLDFHVLDMTGDTAFSSSALGQVASSDIRLPSANGSFREVLYDDGGSARQKADAIAASAMALSGVQATGGFTRNGAAATTLTPVVDSITVDVAFESGLAERVEYTKARSTTAAFAERTLQRIQRTGELFSGQDALKREVREYRLLAAAERGSERHRPGSHSRMGDVFSRPVGSENAATVTLLDSNNAAPTRNGVKRWQPGDLVWVDAKGAPVTSGGAFGGVVVNGGKAGSKEIEVAYSGRVPMAVKPGIQVNQPVFANAGGRTGETSGSVVIGMLAHGEPTPDSPSGELLAMVNLGGGGSSGCRNLKPTLSKEDGQWRIRITSGISGGGVPTLNSSSLTDNPAPYAVVSGGTMLWLVVTWRPNKETKDGVSWMGAGGTWESSDFVLSASQPAQTEPEVSPGGDVTNGVFAFAWAVITPSGDGYKLEAERCGNHQFASCGATLKLAFD